ncbi:hypothetical protein ACFLYK_01055 [Candidatus Cloacimonadota bacterium]
MARQISFATLGNEFLHKMRDQISNSEDKIDLGNSFSYIVSGFLGKVFAEKEINIEDDSILFDPEAENYYSINSELLDQGDFSETWQNSDLPNLIKKFADSTYHRYIHLNKHKEKTDRKIRN